jgi:hypothetical protein
MHRDQQSWRSPTWPVVLDPLGELSYATRRVVVRTRCPHLPPSEEEDAAATLELSEGERARIRAEMRYAALAVRETRPSEAPKGRLAKALDYLSNGFVLLIVGSLITSFLVPRFQRAGEARRQRAALMQEALEQFLLYSNSIWQEFYATLPLALEAEIAKEQYVE